MILTQESAWKEQPSWTQTRKGGVEGIGSLGLHWEREWGRAGGGGDDNVGSKLVGGGMGVRGGMDGEDVVRGVGGGEVEDVMGGGGRRMAGGGGIGGAG